MAFAAELNLRPMVDLAWVDRLAVTIGVLFGSFVATDALHAGYETG